MTIFEAFKKMSLGVTVSDQAGIWYKKSSSGELIEPYDCGNVWSAVDELRFGTINGWWTMVQ